MMWASVFERRNFWDMRRGDDGDSKGSKKTRQLAVRQPSENMGKEQIISKHGIKPRQLKQLIWNPQF